MKKPVLTLTLALLILLSGCNSNTTEQPPSPSPSPEAPPSARAKETAAPPPSLDVIAMTLEDMREIVDANRQIIFPTPHPELKETVGGYAPPELDEERDNELAELLWEAKRGDNNMPEYLSHDEIIDEIEFLFELLKYGYAAYSYFGGDEGFGAVKEKMLEDLALMPDPVSNESYLGDLLYPSLISIITDNHFWVGNSQTGYRMGISNRFYINEEHTVYKSADGFVTEVDGRMCKVMKTDWLLPTLTKDGELAYAFGKMICGESRHSEIEISVEFEDTETSERFTCDISLFPVSSDYRKELSQDLYTVGETGGITVLANRRLFVMDGDPQITEFIDTGKALRDEPVLILDLRSNGGGNSGFAGSWVMQYTGKSPANAMFSGARLHSRTSNQIFASGNSRRWDVLEYSAPVSIPNENLVIVLMDNGIGSSGEAFIAYLRQLDNVVFVGTNTMGGLVTGDVGNVPLPASKQWIQFGIGINIRPDFSQFEGVGFMPDLWVPPGEALERVVEFVKRYGISA